MKKRTLLYLMVFPFFSEAETITIGPESITNVVYSGFSASAPASQTPTQATWGDAWLIGTPFTKNDSTYPIGWAIEIVPNANVPSHNSGKLGYITVTWSNDNGSIAGTGSTGGSVQNLNLPSSGNRTYFCYRENNAASPVNSKFQWKISRLQLDNPLGNNISWKLSYVKCAGKDINEVKSSHIIGYTNQSTNFSGCDINFTNNFNVVGQVNHPIIITETGLSKSRCTSGNKYTLSFSSNSSNIKIVPPNNGTPSQNYTIGDVSTVSSNGFPTYRVESSTAGEVKGTIQLNLTSK
ncbi:hypothetical protein MKV99_001440 [Escherichia coli]|nr:hypothetical protein [Escherichia coli]